MLDPNNTEVNIPSYRLKQKIILGVQIKDPGLIEFIDGEGYYSYRGICFNTNREPLRDDYIGLVDGVGEHFSKREFERAFEPNTKDNWQSERIEMDDSGFEWALVQLKSGMSVTRGGPLISPFYEKDGLHLRIQQDDEMIEWLPSIEDMRAENWQVIFED